MKKILIVISLFVFSTFMALSSIETARASSNLCFLCGSGSSCQQCPSISGKDTQKDRKACESKGCKITGTSSCSSAANIKKCN